MPTTSKPDRAPDADKTRFHREAVARAGAVRIGLWLSKIALYIGLFIGVGGVFALRVLMPDVRRGRRAIIAALAVGMLGAIVSIGFQGLDALGAESGCIAEPIMWSTGFGTSYGRTVVAALAAFAIAALSLTSGQPSRLAAIPARLSR